MIPAVRPDDDATVMVRVPKQFVDETLWPEFRQLSDTLRSYLDEVTERVVGQVVHPDSTEPTEVAALRISASR